MKKYEYIVINDGRKRKCSNKNLSKCHFVHHKSHTDCPTLNLGLHDEKLVTDYRVWGVDRIYAYEDWVHKGLLLHDEVSSSLIKGREFLDQLINYQLVKKNSPPWSEWVTYINSSRDEPNNESIKKKYCIHYRYYMKSKDNDVCRQKRTYYTQFY